MDSMELATTNDSWLHHISPYVKYLTAGLFATANDEHMRRIWWCTWHTANKYDTPGWEICKYRCVHKNEVMHFSVCPDV